MRTAKGILDDSSLSFGLISAVHCVIQAAREAQEIYPEAAKAIKNDFYMDDCATRADTEEEVVGLAKIWIRS